MSYFKLHVSKFEELLAAYNKKKKEYEEQLISFYSILSNFDSVWNDNNTPFFKLTINEDKNKIMNYLSSLEILFNKLSNFNDELIKILSSYGFSGDINYFKFDDSLFNNRVNNLRDVVLNLNNALVKIDNKLLSSNTIDKSQYITLKKKISASLEKTEQVKKKYENFVMDISKLLLKYKKYISKIDGLMVDVNQLIYDFKCVNLKDK